MNVINLRAVARAAFEDGERPIHRRVWFLLSMQRWRSQWRRAHEAQDWNAMADLERQYEQINGI